MSTNHYNIDGPRSSSRVLRPPGGSFTDILGIKDDSQNTQARSAKSTPKSSIADCFNFNEDNTKKEEQPQQQESAKEEKAKVENQTNGNSENKQSEEVQKVAENGNSADNKKTEPAAPQRVRVPPGGWSSGLW